MNKKILILYTSVGLGHKYIALNIAYHLERAGFKIMLHDVLQLQDGVMVKFGEWFHSLINRRFPFVWRWLYFSKLFSKVTMPLRVPLAGGNRGHIKKVIDEFHPDMVIATQTSASAPVAYMKQHKEFNGLFVIAFSDYHFHPYWYYEQADLYLANIVEQQSALEALGVPSEKIAICGITLQPQQPVDSEAVKQQLGLVGKRVILLSSGSLGIGFPESKLIQIAQELRTQIPDAMLVVVCGKNEAMKHRLEQEVKKQRLPMKVLGFYEPMTELYAITEVFLTKPGGLTVAEALRDNVPMLVTHFLPGQEELNYQYLIDKQLMHPIPQPNTSQKLIQTVQDLFNKGTGAEHPNSAGITQKNNEGAVLIKSIKNLFHVV